MNLNQISDKDFDLILKMDKKVYPTSNPVTKSIIKSWYINNPEFGMIYKIGKKTVGTTIIIPLNKIGWTKLINGKLSESQMNSKVIFNNKRDKEIAIHIYHIEKVDKTINKFYNTSLKDIKKSINNLRKTNPKLKIIGLSGLCVTKYGIGLFENKFKCKERKYICKEYIFKKKNKLFVFEAKTEKQLNELITKGYKLQNKCKMLVVYPNEKSIAWKHLK